MSFVKKLLILVCCAAMVQPAFAMHKKQFGKVFKTYLKKNTKKVLNGSKQKWPLNKMPKLSFGTTYLKNMNWKKIAVAGALATGYGLWTLNETVVSADAPAQEKSWDTLNKKEKDILAASYIENIHSLKEQAFIDAPEEEKDLIIYAITQSLLRKQDVSCLYGVYKHSNEYQQNILAQGIADSMSQGKQISNRQVVLIYSVSNDSQKTMLITGIADSLNRGKYVDDMYTICDHSKHEHISILVSTVTKLLQDKKQVQGVGDIYYYADKTQKDILIKVIAYYIGSGEKINTDDLRLICSKSDQSQNQVLINTIVDCLEHNKPIRDVEEIYDQFNNMQARGMLFPAIYQSLLKGYRFDALDTIYTCSTTEQKDLLLSFIIKDIGQGKILYSKKIPTIFKNSSPEQKALLFPAIVQLSGQGNNDVFYIYNDCSQEQKDFLFKYAVEHARKGDFLDLGWMYCYAENQEKRDILFPIIIELLEQGKLIVKLDWICDKLHNDYHADWIENREKASEKSLNQKKQLIDVIIKRLEQGQAVENIQKIAAYYSTPEQYAALKKLYTLLPEKFINSLNIDLHTFSKTQTGQHFLNNFFSVFSPAVQNSHIVSVIQKAVSSEGEYQQKGYYIFYHAQKWRLFWLAKVYAALWEIKHQQSLGDYLFPRFPNDTECRLNAKYIEKNKKHRKQIMQQGNKQKGFDSTPFLVFLNYGFFANATVYGSSSFDFFSSNTNISDPGITTYDIFKKFELEAVYQENKQHIDLLEQQFLELTELGNMLQVAIPKKHIEKHLYLSASGGAKKTTQIKMDNGVTKHIDDIAQLIEILRDNSQAIVDSDKQEFVWVVTADTIHKAKQDGVQIKSFNTADPKKLKQVTDELTSLLTEKLAGHWVEPQPTPWECYKKHKKTF